MATGAACVPLALPEQRVMNAKCAINEKLVYFVKTNMNECDSIERERDLLNKTEYTCKRGFVVCYVLK